MGSEGRTDPGEEHGGGRERRVTLEGLLPGSAVTSRPMMVDSGSSRHPNVRARSGSKGGNRMDELTAPAGLPGPAGEDQAATEEGFHRWGASPSKSRSVGREMALEVRLRCLGSAQGPRRN